jgi:hypothetical protein
MSITAQSISLDDILKQNPIVLADNSINDLQGADWYRRAYDHQTYAQLCDADLEEVIESLTFSHSLWSHPRIHSTEKVVDEVKAFRDLLTDKQDFLLRAEQRQGKPKRGIKRYEQNIDAHARRNQELFSKIVHLQQRVVNQAVKSQIHTINWPIVNELEAYITRLGEALGAKKDYSVKYGVEWTKRPDKRTDEQLVAIALYLSIFDQMPTGILTRDSDLKRLTAFSAYYLSHADTPNAKIIERALQRNPVRVYFLEAEDRAVLDMDTSLIDLELAYVNRYPAGDQLQTIFASTNALITPWNIREYAKPVVQVLSYQPPPVQKQPPETMFKRLLRNFTNHISRK